MKKFCSVGSYSAVAALILALGLENSPAYAGEFPTLVQLQAASTVDHSPVVIAAIDRIAKFITTNPQSKQGKKALSKLNKIQDKAARIENDIKALKEKLSNPSLSATDRAKLEKQLADKTGQLLEQKTKILVQQQQVDLAEAKAQEKQIQKDLRRAEKSGASQDVLERLRKAYEDARNHTEKQRQDVANAKNGKPVDDSKDDPRDPKASPSR